MFWERIKKILNSISFIPEFLAPPLCTICDSLKENRFFCSECLEKILKTRILPPFCPKCGKNLKKHKCKLMLKNIDKVIGIFYYRDIVIELIERYKFTGYRNLAQFFAPFLLRKIEELNLKESIIVSCPSHPSRIRDRGFDHIELIVKELKNIDKTLKIRTDILSRVKPTKPQIKIKKEDLRKKNVEKAFVLTRRKAIENKNILLIDDVFTTGATLEECAKILKQKGANKIFALCIALS